MCTPELYERWQTIAKDIALGNVNDWKQNPSVTYMLEHEYLHAATAYVQVVQQHLPSDVIQELARLNDSIGTPTVQTIGGIRTSTSSMRYIRHAFELCRHIQSKGYDSVDIIEIGGGYGGMALIMSNICSHFNIGVKRYTIYDIPSVKSLQQYYLSHFTLTPEIEWKECSTFGKDYVHSGRPTFLFSSYAVSELHDDYRRQYLTTLLPIVQGAFFVWNGEANSRDELPINRREEPENPNTNFCKGLNTWIWI